MRLLLDTHVLLWWATADRKLTTATRDAIASTGNEVAVSAATFWEIAIKSALGRIRIDLGDLLTATNEDGFEELPVRAAQTVRLVALPPIHSDPFDRLLIAQAIEGAYHLVTRDELILQYAGRSELKVLEA